MRTGKVLICLMLFAGYALGQSRGLLQERARFEVGRGDVFAVVVGISDYASGGIRKLSYAHSDAQAFAAFLQSDQGGRVPVQNILVLVNEQATERAVRSALLDWLPEQANRKEHTVIVFFAGHGVVYRGNPMLLVRDTDASRMGGSSVPMDVVERAFNIIEADRKLFFVDACHSGAVREVALAARSMSGDVLIDRLSGTGRIVIASSRGDQSSYESDALGAGFFTHYLLEGLKGAADRDGDGYVEVEEAFRYTYEKVSDAVVREKKLQNPRIKGEIEGVVLLSRVQGVESAAERARREAAAAQAERDRLARELAGEKERLATAQAQAEAERARQEALRLQRELDELRRQQQTVPSTATPSMGPGVGEMVFIAAGEFMMGSNDGRDNEKPVYLGADSTVESLVESLLESNDGRNEKPVHRVNVDGFWMDKTEVRNAAYAEFVRVKGHRSPESAWGKASWNTWRGQTPPLGMENHPVVGVSWEDARAYCEWAGKRLPTEAEWEKAARGGLEGMKYPWGDGISPGQANYDGSGKKQTTPVGSYAANGYGLYDMSGNVWEWVSDWYDENYYSKSPSRNPTGPISGTLRVGRGGSLGSLPFYVRVAYRGRDTPGDRNSYRGFRCARNK